MGFIKYAHISGMTLAFFCELGVSKYEGVSRRLRGASGVFNWRIHKVAVEGLRMSMRINRKRPF